MSETITASNQKKQSLLYMFLYATIIAIVCSAAMNSLLSSITDDPAISMLVTICASNFIITVIEYFRLNKNNRFDLPSKNRLVQSSRLKVIVSLLLAFCSLCSVILFLKLMTLSLSLSKSILFFVLAILSTTMIIFCFAFWKRVVLGERRTVHSERIVDDKNISKQTAASDKPLHDQHGTAIKQTTDDMVVSCYSCGGTLPYGESRYCPFCGSALEDKGFSRKKFFNIGKNDRIYFRSPVYKVRVPVYRFKKCYLPPRLEERLEKEFNLISSKTGDEWLPGDSSLRTWYANLPVIDRHGRKILVTFEIIIPPGFPRTAPVIRSLSPVDHPVIRFGGYVYMTVLKNWTMDDRLFEAVLRLKEAISGKQPQVPLSSIAPYHGIKLPRSQIIELKRRNTRPVFIKSDKIRYQEKVDTGKPDLFSSNSEEDAINSDSTVEEMVDGRDVVSKDDLENTTLIANMVENAVSSIVTKVNRKIDEISVVTSAENRVVRADSGKNGINMSTLELGVEFGEILTTLTDLAKLKLPNKAYFISKMSEISVRANKLGLMNLITEINVEIEYIKKLKRLSDNYYERVDEKTIEWKNMIIQAN
ncbi:MAG: hypothetical protein ACFFD4_40125 [Candidatus Odinarchaeota archaeon]